VIVRPVIVNLGGSGAPVLFAHANGYPPLSYQRFFQQLYPACELRALEHRPLWAGREPPRRLRWELFADDLLQAMRMEYDRPVWVMGHSMGGTIAALAADRDPAPFAGLLLLDPVILPRRVELAMRLAGERRRFEKNPMVKRALRRPERFDSLDAAFSFYRPKRAFSNLSDEALWDYVRASKVHLEDGGVQLRFSAAWEAAIYASAPRVRPALKRSALPTLGLRGRDSDTLLPDVFARWRSWQPAATLTECPGGHLFPLEHPEQAGQAVREFLAAQAVGQINLP
jgi:pimeloyl-ACP methyl ester carboxylesterase